MWTSVDGCDPRKKEDQESQTVQRELEEELTETQVHPPQMSRSRTSEFPGESTLP